MLFQPMQILLKKLSGEILTRSLKILSIFQTVKGFNFQLERSNMDLMQFASVADKSRLEDSGLWQFGSKICNKPFEWFGLFTKKTITAAGECKP